MQSVELFAGAGGLAIGMANAGFEHAAVLEWNHDACETFRVNQKSVARSGHIWPVIEGDVREFDYTALNRVTVVSGGPPCQPFSLGGKHAGYDDSRDMFPEAVRAIRELRPQAFIFENVKGLLRESFSDYFEYIILQLTHPHLASRRGESWREHRVRLEQHQTARGARAAYNVVFRLLNAADYGVPQKRERVFMVGFRSDLGIEWSFPEPSHSEDSLVFQQWISGEYWDRHKVARKHRPAITSRQDSIVRRIKRFGAPMFPTAPWLTVRDAIADLPEATTQDHPTILNHRLNPGARPYAGHTGSPYDEPSKTLKAGDHGVPGGENMIAFADGAVRYFTIREAARIQTFPDNYAFQGSWSEAMRQLGNAVPVRLAEAVAKSVEKTIRLQSAKT